MEVEPTTTQSAERRLDQRGLARILVGVAGYGAFGWYILWQGTIQPALVWNDSVTYEKIGSLPLLSWGFWASQKGFLGGLLWKATQTPARFILFESLISVVSWGVLAVVVYLMLPKRWWMNLVGAFVVLGFGSVAPIAIWNRQVLSESLGFSSIALLFAGVLLLSVKFSWPRAALLIGAVVMSVGARYTQITTVMVLGLGLVIWAGLRTQRHQPGKLASRRAGILGATLLAVVALSGYAESVSGVGAQNTADVFSVRVFPYPDRVVWFGAHGMPDAKLIEKMARELKVTPGEAPYLDPGIPAVSDWVGSYGENRYAWYMAEHPWLIITEPFVRPELASNFFNGNLMTYAGLVRSDSPLSAVLWPSMWWLIGTACVVWTWMVLARRRSRTMYALAGMVAAGLLTMLVAWHTGAQETTRHTLGGLAEVHLGILLMVMFIVANALEGNALEGAAKRRSYRTGAARGYGSAVEDWVEVGNDVSGRVGGLASSDVSDLIQSVASGD